MNLFRALTFLLLAAISRNTFAIQATASKSIFYTKNAQNSDQWQAKILFSWQAQNSSLHFSQNDTGSWQTELVCIVRCSQNGKVKTEQNFFINTPPKNSLIEALNNSVADQYEFDLDTGSYTLEMLLFEKTHKDQLFQYTDTFSIREHNTKAPFLSDIQLLDTSFAIATPTIYTRNGYFDYPLSSNYLSEKLHSITAYFELYNSNDSSGRYIAPIYVNSYISAKPYSLPIKGFEKIDSIGKTGPKIVIKHNFPLASLNSGNYYINLVLSDSKQEIIDKKSLFIQRYNDKPLTIAPAENDSNSSIAPTPEEGDFSKVLDLTHTFVGKYNGKQVRAILKMLSLIADKTEAASIDGFLDRPDELYSKYFIYNFWEKRNKKNPEEEWLAYVERIKEVNRLFKGSGKPGYETDRGRIYIQYGKPNDRIIVNNESNTFPYEIWQYYQIDRIGKEGLFLFYRPGESLGGYVLLHSTVIGEKRNTSWRSMLYSNSISGSGGFDSDTKAEQYIGNK